MNKKNNAKNMNKPSDIKNENHNPSATSSDPYYTRGENKTEK